MQSSSKNIVIFFGKNRYAKDPFEGFGNKRSVYHELFQYGTNIGCRMYLVCGSQNYKNGGLFTKGMLYENGGFSTITDEINADAVYDRSGGLFFPPKDFEKKILNTLPFKELCADKNKTYSLLKEKMPKNITIKSKDDFSNASLFFSKDIDLVLKPANGFGGEDIFFGKLDQLKRCPLEEKKEYALQEFIDTSKGIPEIVTGYHDLRIVIVGGKIIFSTIRTPKTGEKRANVKQGGSIREIPLTMLPTAVFDTAQWVQEKIDSRFHRPIYSIDLGMKESVPVIFELNDQIGFPNETMPSASLFVKSIINSLILS